MVCTLRDVVVGFRRNFAGGALFGWVCEGGENMLSGGCGKPSMHLFGGGYLLCVC